MKKILLAEDDTVTRTLLSEQVRSFGYEVLTCEDGQQAYTIFQETETIDLLITDVRMPNMDGTALIEKLRTTQHYAKLPIIIMSGVVGVKDISNLLKQGASRFLAKPIDPSDLQETIKQAFAVPYCEKR